MRQLTKIFSGIALLALGLQSARAFSYAGPIGNGGDAWQTAVIGYGLGGDLVAPKNIDEEYRRNIKTLYYGYDSNFKGYFGSNGMVAIDGAFAILNSLTNVDLYSTNLSEFPLETRGENYEASALGLFDLKSFTLGEMMEQMGLADPIRYSWTLHDRYLPPGDTCPAQMEYLVMQRNYDTVSSPLNEIQYSPYVNDVLYNYYILENCTGGNPLAYTVPFSVDPLADAYSPLASFNIGYGDFYSGLTRDDVAGFRSLMSTNNVNVETIGAGGVLMTTNIGTADQEQPLTTADLSPLLAAASTNAPAALQALFPNVTVASSSFTFSAVYTPNVIAYFTNEIGAPYGSAQISVIVTNGTIGHVQTNFFDIFANVITNGNLNINPNILNPGGYTLNYSPNTAATLVTTSIGPPGYGTAYPAPVVTNTTVQSVTQAGVPSGEYFVIPAGQCGWRIVSPQPPGFPIPGQPVYTTNIIASATNSATTSSNGVVTTNATTGFVTTESIVTAFTNHTYMVEPITCSSTPAPRGKYQGIERVQFVREDVDDLTGQYIIPVTNEYTMVVVTDDGKPVTQYIQRVVTAPDFLFSAADLASGPGAAPVVSSYSRNINFDQANILPGLAGPGVINPPVTMTFDKATPVYYNTGAQNSGTPYFTDAPNNYLNSTNVFYDYYFLWGSFDGSTNEPVVFPNGTSIANLENEALVQLSITPANGVNSTTSPPSLANGTHGAPYGPVTFSATDASQPLIWSWSPVTGETLPPGLTFMSNPDSTATLSGTPTQPGLFDFTIQMTDSINRSVQWTYTISIQ
jgi:hypothetical protein